MANESVDLILLKEIGVVWINKVTWITGDNTIPQLVDNKAFSFLSSKLGWEI